MSSLVAACVFKVEGWDWIGKKACKRGLSKRAWIAVTVIYLHVASYSNKVAFYYFKYSKNGNGLLDKIHVNDKQRATITASVKLPTNANGEKTVDLL